MGEHVKTQKKRKVSGIKKKLISSVLPAVAVVLLLIIIISYFLSTTILNNSANNRVKSDGLAVTNDISGWINEKVGMVETIRGTLENTTMTDKELMDYLVYTVSLDVNMPYGIYIGDANNNYIDPTWVPDAGFVPSERDWYKEGLNHEVVELGVPYQDAQSGEFVVSATARLNNVLEKDAVMSTDIFLNDLSETIANHVVLDTGYSFMVDTTGEEAVIIAHPNAELAGVAESQLDVNLPEAQALKYIQEDKVSRDMVAGGVKYLVSVNHIEDTNWVVFSCTTKESVESDARKLLGVFAVLFVMGLLIVGIVVERMTHMVVKPIAGLTNNIKEMTHGNFGIEVNSKGNDEVGIMSRQLHEFIENMRVIIGDINTVSGKMNDQAQNSLQISETLHTSASTQASSMRELNMTVEQMANSVMEVANNASSLADIVAHAGERGKVASSKMEETVSVSREGRENMENIETAMKEIEHSVMKLQEVVTAVGSSTEEISYFVGWLEVDFLDMNIQKDAHYSQTLKISLENIYARKRELEILWNQRLLGRNVFEEMIESGAKKIEDKILVHPTISSSKKQYADWYSRLLVNNMLVSIRWWFSHSDTVTSTQITNMMKQHMISGTIPTLKAMEMDAT